jgi:hypothetical protein
LPPPMTSTSVPMGKSAPEREYGLSGQMIDP